MKTTASAVKTLCDMPKSHVQKLILKLPQNTHLQQLGLARSAAARLQVLRTLRDVHPDIFSEVLWLAEGKNLPDQKDIDLVPLKSNILCLVEACRKLKVKYTIDSQRGIVAVYVKPKQPPLYFKRSRAPFNSAVVSEICKDKDALNSILQDSVHTPKGECYLDPDVEERYQPYRMHLSLKAIAKDAMAKLGLPLIVKPNAGSEGRNVAKCTNSREVITALAEIYNKDSADYDSLALLQEYVEIAHEYRAVAFMGTVLLVYEKDISKAQHTDNFSPLHWQGAVAKHITDKSILASLQEFTSNIYSKLAIEYCGYDIAIDKTGKMWLIEANTVPMFTIFLEHNSADLLIDMYEKILHTLFTPTSR
ncbi:alpha-L-glutamate ligase [Candidatus Saccharibacteria bacterium]|nr:alpha-L-glutamate ligase [Candidatus Saccharibacteria bacterium]